jgi:hypothetical protein
VSRIHHVAQLDPLSSAAYFDGFSHGDAEHRNNRKSGANAALNAAVCRAFMLRRVNLRFP